MSSIILRSTHLQGAFGHKMGSLMATLQQWMDRRYQRQQLAQLDARQLRDIGLDAEQVQAEIKRPFWR